MAFSDEEDADKLLESGDDDSDFVMEEDHESASDWEEELKPASKKVNSYSGFIFSFYCC